MTDYEVAAFYIILAIAAIALIEGFRRLFIRNDTADRWRQANEIWAEHLRDKDERLRGLLDTCPIRPKPVIIDADFTVMGIEPDPVRGDEKIRQFRAQGRA